MSNYLFMGHLAVGRGCVSLRRRRHQRVSMRTSILHNNQLCGFKVTPSAQFLAGPLTSNHQSLYSKLKKVESDRYSLDSRNGKCMRRDNITQPNTLNSGAEFDAAPGRFGCQLRWVRVGWGKNCPLFF